jgi:hypothetical protein
MQHCWWMQHDPNPVQTGLVAMPTAHLATLRSSGCCALALMRSSTLSATHARSSEARRDTCSSGPGAGLLLSTGSATGE